MGWRVIRAGLVAVILLTSIGIYRAPAESVQAAPASNRLGVNAHVTVRNDCDGREKAAVDGIAKLGVGWVKEDFRWDYIEPTKGKYNWACFDRVINEDRARGLEVLGTFGFTAAWAVGGGRGPSYDPPPLDLWSNYVAQTVGRYKDRVRTWEVWNEPNERVFWTGTKEQYAALLRVTYDTVKRVDPGARVLAPAVTGVDEAESWLAALPSDKYDILSLHVYTEPRFLNDGADYSFYTQGMPRLAALVARYGNKPLWITEYGFSSQGGSDRYNVGSEEAQARYLTQQTVEMLAFAGLPLERVFPYTFDDHDGFGLVNGWTKPKRAYTAYQALIARLAGATPRGRIDAGPGIMAFGFELDGRLLDVVWAANGNGTAVIPSGSDGETYSILGERGSVRRSGNELRVAVGGDPVYVLHSPSQPQGVSPEVASSARSVAELHAIKSATGPLGCFLLDAVQAAGIGDNCADRWSAATGLPSKMLSALQTLDANQSAFDIQLGGGNTSASAGNSLRGSKKSAAADGDYRAIARPVPPKVDPVPAEGRLTPIASTALNELLDNAAQQTGLKGAIVTTISRSQGAQDAGDPEWEARQATIARTYAGQLSDLVLREVELRATLQGRLRDGGVTETTLSATSVRRFQDHIAKNGLPKGATEVYLKVGAEQRTIQRLGEVMQEIEPNAVASSFPANISSAPVKQELDNNAAVLRTFSRDRCFAETGKCVTERFQRHWDANGGLAIYGFPISPPIVETLGDGKTYTVQWFERARFEYHPEISDPQFQILLGQFGRQLHPLYPPVPDCGCGRYFPETGHNIAGDFKDYWEKNGGLAQFGFPITDPVVETLEDGKKYTVQWFERARFESHPESADPQYRILLGQFGRVIYASRAR